MGTDTNTTAREFAASTPKRDALAAALTWMLSYEGMSGRPLQELVEAGDVDWNYEQVPADMVKAVFVLDDAIRQHDQHTLRSEQRRSLARARA